jgi:hypothetical protein
MPEMDISMRCNQQASLGNNDSMRLPWHFLWIWLNPTALASGMRGI